MVTHAFDTHIQKNNQKKFSFQDIRLSEIEHSEIHEINIFWDEGFGEKPITEVSPHFKSFFIIFLLFFIIKI